MLLHRLDRDCAGAKPFRLNADSHANHYGDSFADVHPDSIDPNRDCDQYINLHAYTNHDNYRNEYHYTDTFYPAYLHCFGNTHSDVDSHDTPLADTQPDKHPNEYPRADRYNDGYDHTFPINERYPSIS